MPHHVPSGGRGGGSGLGWGRGRWGAGGRCTGGWPGFKWGRGRWGAGGRCTGRLWFRRGWVWVRPPSSFSFVGRGRFRLVCPSLCLLAGFPMSASVCIAGRGRLAGVPSWGGSTRVLGLVFPGHGGPGARGTCCMFVSGRRVGPGVVVLGGCMSCSWLVVRGTMGWMRVSWMSAMRVCWASCCGTCCVCVCAWGVSTWVSMFTSGVGVVWIVACAKWCAA